MQIPDTLQHRLDLFKEAAIAYQDDADLFRVDSWIQVLRGQGLHSDAYHHMGKLLPEPNLRQAMGDLKTTIDKAVGNLPKHEEFLKQYGVSI